MEGYFDYCQVSLDKTNLYVACNHLTLLGHTSWLSFNRYDIEINVLLVFLVQEGQFSAICACYLLYMHSSYTTIRI